MAIAAAVHPDGDSADHDAQDPDALACLDGDGVLLAAEHGAHHSHVLPPVRSGDLGCRCGGQPQALVVRRGFPPGAHVPSQCVPVIEVGQAVPNRDGDVRLVAAAAAGATALLVLCLLRRERPQVGRANLGPALWLGAYALCISYGYQRIGAAPGTFVFYAMVLVTLIANDLARRVRVPRQRLAGALVALAGLGGLASGSIDTVTPVGVGLLVATGAAWGLYTAAGRAGPRPARRDHRALRRPGRGPAGAGSLGLVATGVRVRVTASGLGWAVLMGAGTTAFAYVAWYRCQRALSGTTAGTVQLAIPILTAVAAFALLDEALTAGLAVSAALVVAGLLLASRPVHAPAHN